MSEPSTASRDMKVVLLGDAGVGKSSIVLRFVTGTFDRYSEPTIGASFMSRMLNVDDHSVKFQIWDTAGQEKYHSLAPMYYRGAAAAIIVYDITRQSTFKTLQAWVRELQQLGPENIVLALCGNKSDLEERREVATADARAFADDIGAIFLETSAKSNRNISEVFADIARRMPPPQDMAVADDVADLRAAPAGGARAGAAAGGKAGRGCC